MSFSIIIPTINEASQIQAVLEPLQSLRQQGHEIILVDGGSEDDTVVKAKNFVDKIVVAKKGRALQQNSGAERAIGNYLLFLHADTYLPEDALASIAKIEQEQVEWGRFDVKFDAKQKIFSVIAFFMNWRSRLTSVATGDQAIFVRVDVFKKIMGFPGIALMEDIAISKCLRQYSAAYCIKSKVTSSARRWKKKGIVKTILLMWWLRWCYFLGVSPDKIKEMYD